VRRFLRAYTRAVGIAGSLLLNPDRTVQGCVYRFPLALVAAIVLVAVRLIQGRSVTTGP